MQKLIVLISALLLTNLGAAQLNDSIIGRIDTVFNSVNSQSPGYMIALIKDDQFVFEKGYGLAHLEHNAEINKNTCFNIASLSKQITAASIALLMLDDKVHFDDLISDHLEDFPFAGDSIRIKHLIYMTSGINDYHYNQRNNGTDWSSLNFFNIDTAITASYASSELMYKPGSQWSYSNINYMLLTKIIEKISGLEFSQFVNNKIFEPLGMNNSFVNDDIFQVIPNRALGYNHRSKQETDWIIESGYMKRPGAGFLQIHRNSPHYGGSGVYTTMEDWKKWVSNFSTKTLGGQEFYNLIHTSMKFDHPKSNDAFGLVLDEYNGKEIIWYEGGDWGFSSFMIRFPKSETTIVCFSNIGTGNAKSKVWRVYDVLVDSKLIE